MDRTKLTLSPLRKTWIFDLDGTLVIHNGYKTGEDQLLPGARELLNDIPKEDFILILTGREREAAEKTERFLSENGMRYDRILYEMPLGERILFNDSKPSGLRMGYSVECTRNEGMGNFSFEIDENL